MSILVPLYVYPDAGAWDPLYTAAKEHPDVQFRVVVNPCSGPCQASLPDQNYLNEVPKLRLYDNIHPIGYVATNYATKDIGSVLAEIDTYANWPAEANNADFKVDGIFFDETPSKYASEKYEYLRMASEAVRDSTKFQDQFVVHNPGNMLEQLSNTADLQHSYLDLSNITVIYEESFSSWQQQTTFDEVKSHNLERSTLAVILHSIPSLGTDVMDSLVTQIEQTADWLYLTDIAVKDKYYNSFTSFFKGFVDLVDL